MPNRQNTNITASEDYRFAYNGMETDNEVSGNGNSYTTEFRQYDPRLGRWKSLDPLMASFPWQSPYCAFDNNPVYYTDPYGLSATNDKDGEPKEGATKTVNGKEYRYDGEGWGRTQATAEVKSTRDRTPNSWDKVQDDKWYTINNQGGIREAENLAQNAFKGRVLKVLHRQSMIDGQREVDRGMREWQSDMYRAQAPERNAAQQQLEYDHAMMQNPLYMMYKLSPASALVDASAEASDGNYWAAGGILAMEFLPGPTEDIIRSSKRIVKGRTPRGIQKLDAKVQRSDPAYSGINRVTQIEVDNTIRNVMDSPNRIMRMTRNQQGVEKIDFFNPNTGQGVRLDAHTGEFDTFINY